MQKALAAATCAALFGMGGGAYAADVYSGGLKDPVYVAPNSWAGFYIGADLGGLVDDNLLTSKFVDKVYWNYDGSLKGTYTTTKFSLRQDNKDEPIGGVHAGYNFQNGNLVYGLETDANFASDIDYLATIRGRLGWAVDSWLLYATGGAAFISYANNYAVTDWKGTRWVFSDSHQDAGYVVGAGIEKKITPNISIGIEGLYYNFGSDKETHLIDVKEWWCVTKKSYAEVANDENFWTIRARLTYHFPVAADYVPLK